jgi:hypothetical protein
LQDCHTSRHLHIVTKGYAATAVGQQLAIPALWYLGSLEHRFHILFLFLSYKQIPAASKVISRKFSGDYRDFTSKCLTWRSSCKERLAGLQDQRNNVDVRFDGSRYVRVGLGRSIATKHEPCGSRCASSWRQCRSFQNSMDLFRISWISVCADREHLSRHTICVCLRSRLDYAKERTQSNSSPGRRKGGGPIKISYSRSSVCNRG